VTELIGIHLLIIIFQVANAAWLLIEFHPTDDSIQHNGMNTLKYFGFKIKKAPTSEKQRSVA